MKIVLTQVEFETMAAAWVYENLVEKKMVSAKIDGDSIKLEVFGPGDMPQEELPLDNESVVYNDAPFDENEDHNGAYTT